MNANVPDAAVPPAREPVLSPIDRVSEMLFGLFMALTFVGAVSVAESGRGEIRELLVAALGCNLAWGLVDAVMYLVGTITDRGRSLTLVRSVRAAGDAATARALIRRYLPDEIGRVLGDTELDAMRARIAALGPVPERPKLTSDDLVAALAVFAIVVAATFPVALPFVVLDDVETAKMASRAIAIAMLFVGGLALGRHAGYGRWKAGFLMAGLGIVLVVAVIALGG